jgi:hemolysin activation/secretion protein
LQKIVRGSVLLRTSIHVAWIVLLNIVLLNHVSAQDAGALQRELQLQIERSTSQPTAQPDKPLEPKQIDPKEPTIEIKGFKFKGGTLLTDAQLQDVVKPWTNRQVAFSELKDVTIAIQNRYAIDGRIAQANIPPQDIDDGLILIEITEGKLGSVIVEPLDPTKKIRVNPKVANLYLATRVDGSSYIDTKPLARGLALLNELPGIRATGELEPGTNPGESNYRVRLSDGPFLGGQLAVGNYGSLSTGAQQLTANLSLNNLSGFGDQLTLDAIQSLGSTYGQLGYSLPVGHDGWRVGVQGSYLNYQTLSSWSAFQTQGGATTVGANATYALWREQGNNASLRFSFDNRSYSNNQLGVNISDYQINALSAGVSGNIADSSKSLVNYSLAAIYGNLTINNQTQASQDLSGPLTAGSYLKLSVNISRTEELSVLPNTTWLVSLSGQLANRNLNSSEQIYMGGPYAVRAYPVAQGGGSQGFIFTNELQHRLNDNWQLGAFADVGCVQQYANSYENWQGLTNASNNYCLAAFGPTAKFNYEKWVVNAAVAMRIGQNPLYNSSGEQLNADNAYRSVQAWLRASYAF